MPRNTINSCGRGVVPCFLFGHFFVIGGIRTDILRGWQTLLQDMLFIPVSVSSAVLDFVEGSFLFSPDDAALGVLYPVTSVEAEVRFDLSACEQHTASPLPSAKIACLGQRIETTADSISFRSAMLVNVASLLLTKTRNTKCTFVRDTRKAWSSSCFRAHTCLRRAHHP